MIQRRTENPPPQMPAPPPPGGYRAGSSLPPPNYLAAELRGILGDLHDSEHGDVPKRLVRERLERLAEHVEQLGAEPVPEHVLEACHAGLDPEQEIRARAAQALGWQHPSYTDPPEYHVEFWASVTQLAAWIRDGSRPGEWVDETACTCTRIDRHKLSTNPGCPQHGRPERAEEATTR